MSRLFPLISLLCYASICSGVFYSTTLHRREYFPVLVEPLNGSALFSLQMHSSLPNERLRKREIHAQDKSYAVELFANTVEYWIDIGLGQPPQTFSVQVDTGSALLAVPNVECGLTCSHYHNEYDSSLSNTSYTIPCASTSCSQNTCYMNGKDCKFNITYGDGSSLGGFLVEDTLSFPGISSLSSLVTFGSIAVEYPPGSFQSRRVDGILGMAYADSRMTCLPNCATPVLDVLVSEGKVENVFSLDLNSVSYGVTDGGTLTLGRLDSYTHVRNGSADISWISITQQTYYVVQSRDLIIDNTSLWDDSEGSGLTVVDSGTTCLILRPYLYNRIKQYMQEHYCHLPGVCGSQNIFDYGRCLNGTLYNDTTISLFPNISITLDTVTAVIQPKYYMQKLGNDHNKGYCFGIISAGEGIGSQINILGDVFMKGFYTIFDRANSKIGLIGDPGTLSPTPYPPDLPLWAIIFICVISALFLVLLIAGAVVLVRSHLRSMREERKTAGYTPLSREVSLSDVTEPEMSSVHVLLDRETPQREKIVEKKERSNTQKERSSKKEKTRSKRRETDGMGESDNLLQNTDQL